MDVASGRKLWRAADQPRCGIGVFPLAFLPDGMTVLVADHYHVLTYLDRATGKVKLASINFSPRAMGAFMLSADGTLLAASDPGDAKPVITLWDVPNEKEIRRLTGHQGAVVPEDAATQGRQEDLRERTVALGMRAHSIRDDVAGRGRVVEDVLVGDPRSPDGRRRGKDQAEGQDGPSTDGYPSIRSTCRPPRKLFIDPATAPHIPRR